MFRSYKLSENMIFRTRELEEAILLEAVKTKSTCKMLRQKKKLKSSRLVSEVEDCLEIWIKKIPEEEKADLQLVSGSTKKKQKMTWSNRYQARNKKKQKKIWSTNMIHQNQSVGIRLYQEEILKSLCKRKKFPWFRKRRQTLDTRLRMKSQDSFGIRHNVKSQVLVSDSTSKKYLHWYQTQHQSSSDIIDIRLNSVKVRFKLKSSTDIPLGSRFLNQVLITFNS